jgi:hypothetical protein
MVWTHTLIFAVQVWDISSDLFALLFSDRGWYFLPGAVLRYWFFYLTHSIWDYRDESPYQAYLLRWSLANFFAWGLPQPVILLISVCLPNICNYRYVPPCWALTACLSHNMNQANCLKSFCTPNFSRIKITCQPQHQVFLQYRDLVYISELISSHQICLNFWGTQVNHYNAFSPASHNLADLGPGRYSVNSVNVYWVKEQINSYLPKSIVLKPHLLNSQSHSTISQVLLSAEWAQREMKVLKLFFSTRKTIWAHTESEIH